VWRVGVEAAYGVVGRVHQHDLDSGWTLARGPGDVRILVHE
jgi:hypothetical protein